jgi:hypothetical protein
MFDFFTAHDLIQFIDILWANPPFTNYHFAKTLEIFLNKGARGFLVFPKGMIDQDIEKRIVDNAKFIFKIPRHPDVFFPVSTGYNRSVGPPPFPTWIAYFDPHQTEIKSFDLDILTLTDHLDNIIRHNSEDSHVRNTFCNIFRHFIQLDDYTSQTHSKNQIIVMIHSLACGSMFENIHMNTIKANKRHPKTFRYKLFFRTNDMYAICCSIRGLFPEMDCNEIFPSSIPTYPNRRHKSKRHVENKPPVKLNIMQWNINGLTDKVPQLHDLIIDKQIDIVGCQEVHCKSKPPGFDRFGLPESDAVLFVRKEFKACLIKELDSFTIISINTDKGLIFIVSLYVRAKTRKAILTSLRQNLVKFK